MVTLLIVTQVTLLPFANSGMLLRLDVDNMCNLPIFFSLAINRQFNCHWMAIFDHQPITCYLKMTQNPTLWRVSFKDIICNYGTIDFQDLLGNFLAYLKQPHLSGWALHDHGENMLIQFNYVPVHKIKFTNRDGAIVDSIHIWPEQVGAHGQIIPKHFDTVLVQSG